MKTKETNELGQVSTFVFNALRFHRLFRIRCLGLDPAWPARSRRIPLEFKL